MLRRLCIYLFIVLLTTVGRAGGVLPVATSQSSSPEAVTPPPMGPPSEGTTTAGGVLSAPRRAKRIVVAAAVSVSCNKHDLPQQYWTRMSTLVRRGVLSDEPAHAVDDAGEVLNEMAPSSSKKLDAFLWLGDVVYADTPVLPGYWVSTPLAQIQKKYQIQRSCPEYQSFLANSVKPNRVLGVWDDHDFGMNDGGAEYADKDVVQQYFLDFLGEPPTSSRRQRKGLYSFRAIPFAKTTTTTTTTDEDSTTTSEGQHHHHHDHHHQPTYVYAFCIILLDVRYFREPFTAQRSGDMLGEQQWLWLDGVLSFISRGGSGGGGRQMPQHDGEGETNGEEFPTASINDTHDHARREQHLCAVVLIGSGIQFLLDEKPTEHWGNFPRSRNRLLSMLRAHRVERVVFLSGDVHLGEIGLDRSADAIACLGYPLVEMTSSGLTHSASGIPLIPMWFEDMFPTPRRVGVHLEKNFGSITLLESVEADDGAKPAPLVLHLRVHDLENGPADGRAAVSLRIPIEQLEYGFPPGGGTDAAPSSSSAEEDVPPPCCIGYPDSHPGAVKRILMATQRYLLPNAKFHQLINLYVFGALLVICVAFLWMLRVLWVWCGRWISPSRRKVD